MVTVLPSHLANDLWPPVVRKQFINSAVLLRRKSCQHIFQIGIRIVPIQFSRLDQDHHRSSALSTSQLTGEQTV